MPKITRLVTMSVRLPLSLELTVEADEDEVRRVDRCDCCAEPLEYINGVADYATDDEVCKGSDDPGFYLCADPDCVALYATESVEARRQRFTLGRRQAAENEARRLADVDWTVTGADVSPFLGFTGRDVMEAMGEDDRVELAKLAAAAR